MPDSKSTADFMVRLAARFLKDPAISSDAKALRAVLGAYADGRIGCTYVQPSTLQEILGWGRDRREAAQRELVRGGWLRLGWKRGARARWASLAAAPAPPVFRSQRGTIARNSC